MVREAPSSGRTFAGLIQVINSHSLDLYLRGKVNAGSENRDNNETAIKLLEQALAADPTFAPAYAALARAYHIKAFYFAPDSEKEKLNEDAQVAVEKALRLASQPGPKHTWLAACCYGRTRIAFRTTWPRNGTSAPSRWI